MNLSAGLTSPGLMVEPSCAVCATRITGPRVACQRCHVPYHKDCWDYVGNCSIFGCMRTPARLPAVRTAAHRRWLGLRMGRLFLNNLMIMLVPGAAMVCGAITEVLPSCDRQAVVTLGGFGLGLYLLVGEFIDPRHPLRFPARAPEDRWVMSRILLAYVLLCWGGVESYILVAGIQIFLALFFMNVQPERLPPAISPAESSGVRFLTRE